MLFVSGGMEKPLIFFGVWRSPVSAPALGAGGRRFESSHPDEKRNL